MATRTRVISQNKAVYVSPTGWNEYSEHNAGDPVTGNSLITGHHLHRVDTFSFEMDLAGARQDVREFGQLARIGTVNLTEVNPTLSFGYYLGDGENELALGFTKSAANYTGQMASGQLKEDDILKERNVFLLTVEEGEDAFDLDTATKMAAAEDKHDVVGFGNCFISSYSANFSVGEIPRADVEMQASNVVFYTGINSGILNPSLNLEGERTHTGIVQLAPPSSNTATLPLVLRPQDVTISFDDSTDGVAAIGGPSFSDLPIQSASIELPLAREVIEALGNELAYAKLLEFPIDVTMSISSLTRDFASGALEYALTGTAENNKTNITLNIKEEGTDKITYILQGAVLDNQSFSQGLDDNETVDLTFSAQIGGASTTDQGLFFKAPDASAPSFTVVSGANNKLDDQPIS